METSTEQAIRIIGSVEEARRTVLARRPLDEVELPATVATRIEQLFGEPLTPSQVVSRIIAAVRTEGDGALYRLTRAIDGVELEGLEVGREVVDAVADGVPAGVMAALETAAKQIEAYHAKQLQNTWVEFGPYGALGQVVRPLDRVGIYVPGGRVPYPSSLLMAAIPARVAGVREIFVATPPTPYGVPAVILAAAKVAKVDRVFQVGGAMAVAAMAYGTQSIPRVDKIVGPGNIFVALAKKQVFGDVGIDQVAGPTETLLIADGSADPATAAADLLAQAEHDPMATPILITDSPELASKVQLEVQRQLTGLSRREIILQSLQKRGAIVLARDLQEAVEAANEFAPEHLCLLTRDPWALLPLVRNAGGVFLGEGSPEVMGDYVAGPSHIMPTGGSARFASPIDVAHFLKRISLIALSEEGFRKLAATAVALAEAEGLTAHANAVRRRLERENDGRNTDA